MQTTTAQKSPPPTPSHVFLGEIFGANLCLPKKTPKIYPPPSTPIQINTTNKTVKTPLTNVK